MAITVEQREQIVKLRKEGKTLSQVARSIGCAESTVSYWSQERTQQEKKKSSKMVGTTLRRGTLQTEDYIQIGRKDLASLALQAEEINSKLHIEWMRSQINEMEG